MGTGRWIRVAAVAAFTGLVAVMTFGLGTASAPAGNRAPASAIAADPGPKDNATYGANVAFTTTLNNSQKSAYVSVRLEIEVPKTFEGATPRSATFKKTSCPGFELLPTAANPEKFVCNWGRVSAGDFAKVLIVWETPRAGTSLDCADTKPTATASPCMTTKGTWFIKEGGQTKPGGPDTFPTNLTGVSFLVNGAPSTQARGYALGKCDGEGGDPASALSTAPGDALQTTVCPSSDVPGSALPLNPGLIVRIDEGEGEFNAGLVPTAFVCIPDPLAPVVPPDTGNCPTNPGYFSDGYTSWNFSPEASITFVIDNTTFAGRIRTVLHNGVDVTESCSITVDSQAQETTIVCTFDEQGGWDFG